MVKKMSARARKLAAVKAAQQVPEVYTASEIAKLIRKLSGKCCWGCRVGLNLEVAQIEQCGVIPIAGIQPYKLPDTVVEELLEELKVPTKAEKKAKKAEKLLKKKKKAVAEKKAKQRKAKKEEAQRKGPAAEKNLKDQMKIERWWSRHKNLLDIKE